MHPLSRRTLLRSAGLVMGLPWLEAMWTRGRAKAAAFPRRFVVFYSPGGTVLDAWRPKGTESAFTFGSILEPLTPLKRHITVLDGLEIKVGSEGYGHPHTRGCAGLLTARPTTMGPYETCGGRAGFPAGISVDQVIAQAIGATNPLRSLQVAIRWPTFFYGGARVSPTNILNYEEGGVPIAPETDPKAVWDRLFSKLSTDPADVDLEAARTKAILGTVEASYGRLASQLGAADRQTLEAHREKIHALQASIGVGAPPGAAACRTDFDLKGPFASASKTDVCDGCVEAPQDTLIPATGKVMMDLTAAALACDLTRVATVQWMDLAANNSFPWLGLNDTHHGYQHDRGYQPDGIQIIDRWYAEQFKYFLDQLASYPEGDGTVLDSTVVFWCKEISHPNDHTLFDMPFVLGGGSATGLRTGRWLRYDRASSSDLLVSFLNLFGVDTNTFGKPDYCNGPLPGLV